MTLRIKKISVAGSLYWLIQPLLLLIFWNLGRDTDEYVDLFDSDRNYLEPLWLLLSELFDLIHLDSPEAKASGVVLVQCIAGFVLLRYTEKYKPSPTRHVLILLLIFSYEVSFVGGALRQGISVFFISAFLLSGNSWTYIAGVLAHWSGVTYLLLRVRLYPVFAVVLLVVVYIGYGEIPYFESALDRAGSYIERAQDLGFYPLLAFSLNKALLILLTLYNAKTLKVLLKMPLLIATYVAPVVQLVILWVTRSELIFQRAGMLFDPFIIVTSVVLLARGRRYTPWVLGGLVAIKLCTRFMNVARI